MRPTNAKEANAPIVWKVDSTKNSVTNFDESNTLTFDKTFDGQATTVDVYSAVAKIIVQSALSGVNGSILA